jgi:hypothetical protein
MGASSQDGRDATLKLFGLFPDLVLFADPADRNEKHDVRKPVP